MSIPLSAIVTQVGQLFGDYASGVVGSGNGGTNTFVDATQIGSGKSLRGLQLVLNGAGGKVYKRVSNYNDATGTITWEPSGGFPATFNNGNTYEVFPLPRVQVVEAINKAIQDAGSSWVQVDEVEYTYNGQTEQALGTGALTVSNVWLGCVLPDSRTDWQPFVNYEVSADLNTRKLLLHNAIRPQFANVAGLPLKLRVAIKRLPAALALDADTLGLDDASEPQAVSFIRDRAASFLHRYLSQRQAGTEVARTHYTLARDAFDRSELTKVQAAHPVTTSRRTRSALPRTR